MNINNVKNKLINDSNFKAMNRNPYGFISSDHINRTASNYNLQNQRDLSSNSLFDTQNYINSNKFNKNLDTSPVLNNSVIYNNNNIINNLNNSNTKDNTFKNSLHDTVFIQSKPTYEFYGYAFYLVSFFGICIWLIWAFSSEEFLKRMGLTYYPKKYWAIAIPDYIVVCVLFYVVIFLGYNFIHTPSFDSLNTVTGNFTNNIRWIF